MKALITAPENTAVVAEIAVPEPAAKEIRVKVHTIALNAIDPLFVSNPVAPPGRVVGSDIVGIVDKLGEGVTQWKAGDRVAGLLQGATSGNPRPGGFAEYAILEADLAIHIPAAVTSEQAAGFPLCSLTAAQALFIRLGLNAPFLNPIPVKSPLSDPPAVFIYSASTAIGIFALELLSLARTPSGKPYRIFATANPKHHAKLLASGVEAAFDYRSKTWIDDVYKASGGISAAFDCISSGESTAQISKTFAASGGTIAVIRKGSWNEDGIKEGVNAIYSAVWFGLGHELVYNEAVIPANPEWRAFSVEFFKFLSAGSPIDPSHFPIEPIPVRLMPGGLDRIVPDAFTLLGTGLPETRKAVGGEPWMKPISGEKVVYRVASE